MAIAPSMTMRQLAAILDSIIEGLIAVDTDGRIVLFNGQAAAIIGCPVKEALGRRPELAELHQVLARHVPELA